MFFSEILDFMPVKREVFNISFVSKNSALVLAPKGNIKYNGEWRGTTFS